MFYIKQELSTIEDVPEEFTLHYLLYGKSIKETYQICEVKEENDEGDDITEKEEEKPNKKKRVIKKKPKKYSVIKKS